MLPIEALVLAPAAFLAGVLMFFAPCTLPIIPGYLAFIAGVPYGEIGKGGGRARKRILVNACAFVLGFSVVFILLGIFAGLIGSLLGSWREILARGAGLVVILFGLTMMGVLQISALTRERRIGLPRFLTVGKPESSFFIGALFALGWSPCIGPILGTVLLYASAHATALEGGLLLGVFSLGLGIPFLLSALLISQAGKAFARIAPKLNTLSVVGGVLLVIFGIMLLTGTLGYLVPTQFIENHMLGYGWFLAHL